MRFLFLLLLVGCGLEPSKHDHDYPQPQPQAQVPPSGQTDDWTLLRPLIQEQCALSGCHAGASFLATGRAMKASRSAALISAGRMPPRRSANYDLWTDDKKRRLLDYLSQ